ncbi:vanadium-dependent haloperoxidase [Maribacter sp. 2304DJ31-5]|uniref:vanadium-dependent haloperoxidase n=1 Tax=Maribacter sp. 2304DJ31-5 TaxID=3386273 RepID=UPI0039BD8D6A
MKSNMIRSFFLVFIVSLLMGSCTKTHNVKALDNFSKDQINLWNKHLTDVMVRDIFSPPVCSRIYAYPNIAAYEALAMGTDSLSSLSEKLTDFPKLPRPGADTQYYWPMVSIVAFAKVSEQMVYDYEAVQEELKVYLDELNKIGIDKTIFSNSKAYAERIAQDVIGWANKDGYVERVQKPAEVNAKGPGIWVPTPPDYLQPIEPHWNTMRPFLIDSASQFRPAPPTHFDLDMESDFYKEVIEVKEVVENATYRERDIARFWDCNPNESYHLGHQMLFKQKISPGGHWMMITSIVTKKADRTLIERTRDFAYVATALADAFISCWDEKYRSNLIRPETYIAKHIDKEWKPILQTPSFPEHTSGHSVASSAAATVLTHLYGDNFSFTDTSEVEFGLPIRDFSSFEQAAQEAAISRLYGGIHYRPAIVDGVEQGKALGDFCLKKIIDGYPDLVQDPK